MLQQLRKGMELYGLVNQMATNPEACHPLFVPGKIIKVTILTATFYIETTDIHFAHFCVCVCVCVFQS